MKFSLYRGLLAPLLICLGACSGLTDDVRSPLALASIRSPDWMVALVSVRIFVQTPLGPELDGEWSRAAEQALNAAALAWLRQNGFNAEPLPVVAERDAQAWADWVSLYQTVSGNAFFVAKMDAGVWRAGSGAPSYSMNPVPKFLVASASLSAMLFLNVSAITPSGAKTSAIAQTQITVGVVDVTNGDILWLNRNTVTNGDDIRTEHGAASLLGNVLAPLAKAAK